MNKRYYTIVNFTRISTVSVFLFALVNIFPVYASGIYRQLCDFQILEYNNLNLPGTEYCIGKDERMKFLEPDIIFNIRRYNVTVYNSEAEAKSVFNDEALSASRGDKSIFFNLLADDQVFALKPVSILIPNDAWVRLTEREISFVPEVYATNRTDPDGPYYVEDWESTLHKRQFADLVIQAGQCVFTVVVANDEAENISEYHGSEQYKDANGKWRRRAVNKHPSTDHNLGEELIMFVETMTRNKLLPHLAEVLSECKISALVSPEMSSNIAIDQHNQAADSAFMPVSDIVSADELSDSEFERLVGRSKDYISDLLADADDILIESGLMESSNITPSEESEESEESLSVETSNTVFTIWQYGGDVEILLPGGGEDDWISIKEYISYTNEIPSGTRIFTGLDASLMVNIGGIGAVRQIAFSDVKYEGDIIGKKNIISDLDLRTGEVEVSVDRGDYNVSLQVKTPAYHASVRGTHFYASYNEDTQTGVIAVARGELEIENTNGSARKSLIPKQDGSANMAVVFSSVGVSGEESKSKVGSGIVLAIILVMIGGYVAYRKRQQLNKI